MNSSPFVPDTADVQHIGQVVGDKLTNIEQEQISLNFCNTSRFVLGKQTNFNGPVTIVNYPQTEDEEKHDRQTDRKQSDDTVIIKDSVLSSSTNDVLRNDRIYTIDLERDFKTSKHETRDPKDDVKIDSILFSYKFCHIPAAGWLLILGIATCVLLTSLVLLQNSHDYNDPNQEGSLGDDETKVGEDDELIILKTTWEGLDASSYVNISTPIPYVVITHTAGSFCYERNTCMATLRNIQKDQMSRTPAYADIANSFLVGGDGNIYEGRGWGRRTALGSFVNNKNYDICFIGDFSVYDTPTMPQFKAVKRLISYGVNMSYISPEYILLAHNASGNGPTLSPGRNIYSEIKTWDHFHPDPITEIPIKKTKD